MQENEKIKVLQCIRQGKIGGGETHLLSLVENLDRSRFAPYVLSFTDGPMVDALKKMKVETFVIPTTIPFDPRVKRKVLLLLEAQQIDLVHAHGTRAISNVFSAARKKNIPLLYTIHGWSFHDDQNPVIKKIRILSERFLTSVSRKNIAVSASNKKTGEQAIPGFSATVINNGIDQNKFNPGNAYPGTREELGIDADAVVVIFIARFSKQKQPQALVQAFKKIQDRYSHIRLLMIGDGEEKPEAIKLAGSLVTSKKIIFLPFRQDVPALLAAADIYVLPSLWEGLPIGLLEAMGMGKAVIATRVDGTSEIIEDGQNGILIDPTDLQKDLPVALEQLIINRELRQKLGDNAVETISENYSAATMTRKIEAEYNNVLGIKQNTEKIISHHGV